MDKMKVIRRLKYQVTFSERSFLVWLHVVMISFRLLSEESCCWHIRKSSSSRYSL